MSERRLLIAGDKLAEWRVEHVLTQQELAEQLDMSVAGVRRLESAEAGGIQPRNFRRLAELAKLSHEQLRERIGAVKFGDAEPRAAGDNTSTGQAAVSSPAQPLSLRGAPKPVVELERFHGVSAARTEERRAIEHGRVPAPAGAGRRFAVVVDGDCMEPKYRDQDVVVFSVDAAEREGIVEGRNYFVQLAGGENTFKRIFFDPEDADRVELRCWNPRYPSRWVERRQITLLARAEYRLVPDE